MLFSHFNLPSPLLVVFVCVAFYIPLSAQDQGFSSVRAKVDFGQKLRDWDGFGVNYVESCQSLDLEKDPQDYGGFSLLDEQEKQEIIEMIFSDDGLKVNLLKMFLDPFHQATVDGAFDHKSTTKHMRDFARRGNETSRSFGRELNVITTMYGPPAWATLQKETRGRDLDPMKAQELANYMVDWADFLTNDEALNLRYLSLHNEGEGWMRWETDGITHESNNFGHDYNLFWPPEQVVQFLDILPRELERRGLGHIGVTPGETYSWDRFYRWGYADAIADDEKATRNLGLITSHGFLNWGFRRWNSEHMSNGIDLLREKRPELHAWVTSTSWGKMDTDFVRQIYGNIYGTKVNAIIPWALIQRPPLWKGSGDPNPGCSFIVREDGSYEVQQGYYFYKQVTVPGQAGMSIVRTSALDSEIALIGFGNNGTEHPDAFVLINTGPDTRHINIHLSGTRSKDFKATRSLDAPNRRLNLAVERYSPIGKFETSSDGILLYEAPGKSVTTFIGLQD
ncbi:hypothetical protein [Pelagicoccus mobilis]|uniref:Glycosyl hydrolase family 30 beta sandwich domain-containing protein n=1 Tax=Pelagicoccus mobilis TaxID=415221 RepID=A0A934RVN9_9BACT|nr:hypothetical protein [Pelagicoccus mobilis]MBK1877667.1 hypothetical protein [Pelagicoccus mobilis]